MRPSLFLFSVLLLVIFISTSSAQYCVPYYTTPVYVEPIYVSPVIYTSPVYTSPVYIFPQPCREWREGYWEDVIRAGYREEQCGGYWTETPTKKIWHKPYIRVTRYEYRDRVWHPGYWVTIYR